LLVWVLAALLVIATRNLSADVREKDHQAVSATVQRSSVFESAYPLRVVFIVTFSMSRGVPTGEAKAATNHRL